MIKNYSPVFLDVGVFKCWLLPCSPVPTIHQGLADCWSIPWHVRVSPPVGDSPSRLEAHLKTVLHYWESLKELPPIRKGSLLCLTDICAPVSELCEFTSEPYPDQVCLSRVLSLMPFVGPPNLICQFVCQCWGLEPSGLGDFGESFYVSCPSSAFAVWKWATAPAGAWMGWCLAGYGAPCQTFSVTGEFCSLMWSFSAFLLNMHLIFLWTVWYI